MITVQLMGNHFRVNPDNFPQLYGMMHRACDILDLPKRPQLYIGGLPGLNAVTAGINGRSSRSPLPRSTYFRMTSLRS